MGIYALYRQQICLGQQLHPKGSFEVHAITAARTVHLILS